MKLTLAPILRGLEITNGEGKLIYKNKLFSLSSEIQDENGVVLATLKRKGWWHLTFSVITPDGEYELEGKWGDFKLTSYRTGELFITNSGVEFYTSHGIRVTEFQRAHMFGSRYSLTINNPGHALAFVMASCLLYKTNVESAGIAAG
ncbi:hypothetical protein [Neptunomonas concharum]|uniref:LURP-one-related family protein n=1 Tax=Neptunomonas concharum TaxID=1031538 RepID=A0A5P1RCE2_9GAMM|nr:hypothetical protein [Neptunomonas concharum]QEQ96925.1 hypothetical protein F0U83_09440 [Neptunomonas concharum]